MPEEGQEGILIDSGGHRLLGILFTAWGEGPAPTAVLLHGMPGIELNYDVALALREHGWNCLIFRYRGCGGSAGGYALRNLPEDARAAVDDLVSGRHERVDPDRIVLIGHSMGGWAALLEAGSDPRVKAVAVVAAAADPASLPFTDLAAAAEVTDFVQGLTPEGFIAQWRALDQAPQALAQAGRIAPRPLLIVHGAQDATVPVAQARALRERAGEPCRLEIHPQANHSFTRHRPWLRNTLLDWLGSLPEAR
ncbi:MAG: alpha/beta fold hydrolase [Holophaga sp.]|nr:alpha/beta fold hydrolase [Holophaga sp.]